MPDPSPATSSPPAAASQTAAARLPPPGRRLGGAVRLAVLALLLGWAAWNLGTEARQLHREIRRPPNPGAVAEWRLVTPRAESLGRFLQAMDAELPADRALAFATTEKAPDQDYFLSLWASYLMPRHRVVRLLPVLDLGRVEYVVVYNGSVDDPRLAEVARHPSGVLYRVRSDVPLAGPPLQPRPLEGQTP